MAKQYKALCAFVLQKRYDFEHYYLGGNDLYKKNTSLKENELTAIIADALMGEPYAVQLVARFNGNNLEMEKDWEMMSEFDKDELIRKKIIREL